MTLNHATELMHNQKNSIVMPPDVQFDVLQTQEGNSLFFSIGGDNVFYITREVLADTHGWSRLDMSTALSANHNNAKVTAKSFDIAQDLVAGTTDIVLVINADGADHLYTSLGNANTSAAWGATPIAWSKLDFDDPNNNYAASPVSDVYLGQAGTAEYIIADINTGDSLQSIARYFVDPTKKISGNNTAWNPHDLSGNLQAGQITNCMGRKYGDSIDAVYTLGSLAGEAEIIYMPVYNKQSRVVPPKPTRIVLPSGATNTNTAMAVSMSTAPYTDLFVVADGGLYFLDYKSQADLSTPTLVYTHTLLQGVTSIHVDNDTTNGNVIVWGQNDQNQVFIMECPAGSELTGATDTTNGTSWTCPIPILFDVVSTASFAKTQVGNSVIFAHTNDGTNPPQLTQLAQDPITTAWQERYILLPPPITIDVPYQTVSYTTHITVTDASNAAQPDSPLTVSASSPCNVYINDVYCALDTTPQNFTTDCTGVLTIVQPVDTIGGICYNVASGTDAAININPLAAPIKTMSNIQHGADLNIPVTDENGTITQLVNPDLLASGGEAVATNIGLVNQSVASLPTDGSVQPIPVGKELAINHKFDPTKDKISGVSFAKNNVTHFSGAENMSKLGLVVNSDNTLSLQTENGLVGLSLKSIEAKAGHIYKWVKKEAAKVAQIIVTIETDVTNVLNNINHFFVTIGEDTFHFVIKCYNDVVNSIHTLLNTLETAFEDMVKWLGFIFSYKDILRTHAVMKNIMLRYIQYSVSNIGSLKGNIKQAFTTLQNDLNGLVGLPTIADTPSSTSAQAPPHPASQTPQANWGSHQLKSNSPNANGGSFTPTDQGDDPTDGLLDSLKGLIAGQSDNMNNTYNNIKAIIENFHTTPISTIFEQILVAITDFLVGEADALLESVADVFAKLATFIENSLTATIDIPVLSWMYGQISGGAPFSILDLVCLVAAIPATIIYKVIEEEAPFPASDPNVALLIAAPDLATIVNIFANETVSITSVGGHSGSGSTGWKGRIYKDAVKAGNIAALVGSAGVDFFTVLKSGRLTPGLLDNKWINLANSCTYLLYVVPDIISCLPSTYAPGNGWVDYFNFTCTWIACIKTGVDAIGGFGFAWNETWGAVSPWVDFLLNIAWQAPTFGGFFEAIDKYGKDTSNTLWECVNLVGGTAFDISGICSPWLWAAQQVFNEDPENPVAMAALADMLVTVSAFNLVWGVSCLSDSYGPFTQPTS